MSQLLRNNFAVICKNCFVISLCYINLLIVYMGMNILSEIRSNSAQYTELKCNRASKAVALSSTYEEVHT